MCLSRHWDCFPYIGTDCRSVRKDYPDLCTFKMHEEKGVKFYLSAGVKEIVGVDGKVTGVTIPSGETLEADMVVAGVGQCPHHSLLFSQFCFQLKFKCRCCACYEFPEGFWTPHVW